MIVDYHCPYTAALRAARGPSCDWSECVASVFQLPASVEGEQTGGESTGRRNEPGPPIGVRSNATALGTKPEPAGWRDSKLPPISVVPRCHSWHVRCRVGVVGRALPASKADRPSSPTTSSGRGNFGALSTLRSIRLGALPARRDAEAVALGRGRPRNHGDRRTRVRQSLADVDTNH
jgi:hypothetical protein